MEIPDSDEGKLEPHGKLERVNLTGITPRSVQIGATLPKPIKQEITDMLIRNEVEFVNTLGEIEGVDPAIISHKLNVDPKHKPVKQKKRAFAVDRQIAIRAEVYKLLAAGFIRRVYYPEWLSNVVLIKKPNGKWRLCIDFTDLNRACPKDSYPLPNIDQLVDSTSGYEVYSFINAAQGYRQIPMHKDDEEKTSFVTDIDTYCYKQMPFGLKNTGATYQRLMNFVFKDQIGRNMEVYVDDIIVKSKKVEDHAKDLEEVFTKLKKYKLKLNPDKCAFGVPARKFIGYLISQKGIEVNPEKTKAILEMKEPKSAKEVQKLNGRITALGRFVFNSAKRCLPFFKTLRNVKKFEWTEECQQSFEELKKFLSSPPLLGRPETGELYLYLSVTNETVASVLVKEEASEQKPVYYTSKVLKGPELRYSKIEKFALALVLTVEKLKRYFQAHTIIVRTNQPLRKALARPETSGRLINWSVMIGSYDIKYEPRTAKKAQILADFVAETTTHDQLTEVNKGLVSWTLQVDGASNMTGAGAGMVLRGPHKIKMQNSIHLNFPTTNNAAEYEALIGGLRMATVVKTEYIKIQSDSQLVVNQVFGLYEVKDPEMKKYVDRVKELLAKITEEGGKWELEQIRREENTEADTLAKAGVAKETMPGIPCSVQNFSSIQNPEATFLINPLDQRMEHIISYIENGSLPEDNKEAKKVKRRAPHFSYRDGTLYRKSFSHPWSRCLTVEEGKYVLAEIHEGVCGSHISHLALCRKAVLQGYYWPTLAQDAANLVQKCEKCQYHQNVHHQPTTEQNPIISPWPFSMWGIDIVGPFPTWVEAEAVSTITEARVRSFVRREIIYRFGIPKTFITDNEKQFDNKNFREFCTEKGIDLRFTSVTHPQSNGMTEVTNRTIVNGLKKRLDEAKGRWADELHSVLWSYRTTPKAGTGRTPYSLTYGCEAMVPVEIGMPTIRVQYFDEQQNEDNTRL
ncbi:uncharacterized protein LOC126668489 [Mercurialis annua]|uniref:uncharacterized protein LOC126668489 n=1 Tax=Mercurialis annua TaxID=3986 RepID=UPI002160A454|nr:uncharacterized protein LOC126668489 [Mercurialis annua]